MTHFIPDPIDEGIAICDVDVSKPEQVRALVSDLNDYVKEATRGCPDWCCSWPCDCGPFAMLNQRCEWDGTNWTTIRDSEDYGTYRSRMIASEIELGEQITKELFTDYGQQRQHYVGRPEPLLFDRP